MMKHLQIALILICSLLTFSAFAEQAKVSGQAVKQQVTESPSAEQAGSKEASFTEDQLAQMLAPIALYPDSLLTHILIASTYPLEIVEAHRWADKNKALSQEEKLKQIEKQEWEPSVKAVVPFDQVISRLNDELTWTQNLGDAFLQDEELVLATIQELRAKAEQAGSLDKMENVEVSREDDNIIIAPVEKEYIYVPYYDTRYVYGHWHWHYPPVYWLHYPHHHHGPHVTFSYHRRVHISFNYHFSAFHWHNRHVVVINHRNTHRYRSNTVIVRSGYSKRWSHKPVHRKGVAYRSTSVKKHYGSNRPLKTPNKALNNNRKNAHQGKVSKVTPHNKVANNKAVPNKHQRVTNNLAKKPQVQGNKAQTKVGSMPNKRAVNNNASKANNRPSSYGNKSKPVQSHKPTQSYKAPKVSKPNSSQMKRAVPNKPMPSSAQRPKAHSSGNAGKSRPAQAQQMRKHN